jgi:uncharacterized protein YbjT (DUF2867 family)
MGKIVIFGPTGNVGAVAARAAAERGAEVVLAMRDIKKHVPGLPEHGKFSRVHADLTKPETLITAVQTSGATRAFIYLAHESQDHMRAAIEALQAGGIEFVTFLSAFGVQDPAACTPDELINWLHAQVEINLREVFGTNFLAVRAGGFATNALRQLADIRNGSEVPLFAPRLLMDWITPNDMGEVIGAILANGPEVLHGQQAIYLYGPDMISQWDAIQMLGQALGKSDLHLKELNEQEGVDYYATSVGPAVAKDLVKTFSEAQKRDGPESVYAGYAEGVENIRRFTSRSPTRYGEWVKEAAAAL